MAKATAVPALGVAFGAVGQVDCMGPGETSDRGSHRGAVPWVYGDDDTGRGLARPGFHVRIEESGPKDVDVPGIVDGVGEAWEEFPGGRGEERDRKGVDGEWDFVGG